MTQILSLAASNLLTPMVLFFALGLVAGRLKSDLNIPEAVSKGMSLYLMLAIGFRGGVELSHEAISGRIVIALLAAVLISFTLPFLASGLLRLLTKLALPDRAAIAAHYGSVSVVTFVTASALLVQREVTYEPYLVAMMALMETPAIVSGLLIVRGGSQRMSKELMHEVFLSGSIVLLLGAFAIGWTTGDAGQAAIAPFVEQPFKGILCLFLLDMGLLTARRLPKLSQVGPMLIAFGIVMPLIGATIGLIAATLLGLSPGGACLMAVLAGSASYIVVPAAMRTAIPEANPALYVGLSLGVTFPFNLLVGIPLYYAIATWIAG